MKSETVATNPLRSGQLINKTALVFMVFTLSRTVGERRSLPFSGQPPATLQVLQNLARGVRSRTARQAGARVCSTAAEIQVCHGRAVSRPIEQWPHGEELIQRQFPVKDLARGEAIVVFQILGRDDLTLEHQS